MKFNFWVENEMTFLEAILEEGDVTVSRRQEGSAPEIRLRTNLVYFNYPVQNIHPDLLALLCLVCFYPFMGDRVTFPQPVSPKLVEALSRPGINHLLPRDHIPTITNLASQPQPYQGQHTGISFGGGMDSSALRALFPEAHLIHESHVCNGNLSLDHTLTVLKPLITAGQATSIRTNLRYITEPGGWSSWYCKFASSLLLATDLNLGQIYTGDILGATFLNNGKKFGKRLQNRETRGVMGNSWLSVFYDLNLPLFSPLCGVTEVGSTYIGFTQLSKDDITWCVEEHGRPCERCQKCMRRALIRAALGLEQVDNWERYNTPQNLEFLQKRPLYMGHIYAYCVPKVGNAPQWLREAIAGLPEADWVSRYYPDAFELLSPALRDPVRAVLDQYLEPMSPADIANLRAWPHSPTESPP